MVKKFEIEEKILAHKHKAGVHTHEDFIFPKKFLWGTATSSHQVEGNNEFNDWHFFEKFKGTIYKNQVSGTGPDHYRRYKEDHEILEQQLHSSVYRLSLEWSRIEPQEGNYHNLHVQHYHHVLRDLKKRGIKIMLTINHFTLPFWFYKKGGWLHHDALKTFDGFVRFVAKEYGQYVDFWLTLNEPMVYASQAYENGEWPPAKNNKLLAYRVAKRLAKAHVRAYRILHDELDTKSKTIKVGMAKNIITYSADASHSLLAHIKAYFADQFWNHWWYRVTKGSHDFIGINYYIHVRMHKKGYEALDSDFLKTESTDMGWDIYPHGIYRAIMDMSAYGLPMYITENGIAIRNDNVRRRYILSYLLKVYEAIKKGADVRGYIYWSFIDNFEWDKGYEPKFGLVSYDEKTLERKVKASGVLFGEIAKTGRISHDMLQYLGHDADKRV